MTTPSFIKPEKPDWKAIDLIHRGNDGDITFHSLDGGRWKDLCTIPANALPGLFPQLVDEVGRDSYFSVASFSTQKKPRPNRRGLIDQDGKRLPLPRRLKSWVRNILAAYVDIDCVKAGIKVGTMVGNVINAQDEGKILPPSIIMRSGYGIWLFWLLAQPNGKLYGGFSDKMVAYERIQQALVTKFKASGGDPKAKDVARVTRIPGSLNCKQEDKPKLVDYWPQMKVGTNAPPTYTMLELSTWLKISLEVKERKRRFHSQSKTGNPKFKVRASKGQKGRWQSAYEQFVRLWELRGTWRKGTRNAAVHILATILKAQNSELNAPKVLAELGELFNDLTPGYTTEEFQKTLQSVRKSSRVKVNADGSTSLAGMSNQYLADALEVTIGESRLLKEFVEEVHKRDPRRRWKGWPPAQSEGAPADEPVKRMTGKEVKTLRRKFLQNLAEHHVEMGSALPTMGDLAEAVADVGKLPKPSEATIMRDLAHLEIQNPRAWSGRKKKRLDNQEPLPFVSE